MGDAAAFGSTAAAMAFRSSSGTAASWIGQLGMHLVSTNSPLDEWPGADTGHARAPLLRAHPLLLDGVVRAERLGRVLVHGTLEFHRPVLERSLAQVSLAAFADVAKRGRTRLEISAPVDLDAGGGFRVRTPGASGMLRLDVARSLRDGNVVVSAAWQPSWPWW
jgi:hypothetical protein